MQRKPRASVTVSSRSLHERDGLSYPLDRLVVVEGGLYYGRAYRAHQWFTYHEKWLLSGQNWVVNRFSLHPHLPQLFDWYIDIDPVVADGDVWYIDDWLLDVQVNEGRRCLVQDADELAEAIEQDVLGLSEATAALRSLAGLCKALERLNYSVMALLQEFAPGLPT